MDFQTLFTLVMLFVLGVLGAASVIIQKKPNAKELIDKMAKIGGYVGIVAVLWGAWDMIWALRNMTFSFGFRIILVWLTYLASAAVLIGLGVIFGYGLAASYMNEQAKQKSEPILKKLLPYQTNLGFAALGLFVWFFILRFLIF